MRKFFIALTFLLFAGIAQAQYYHRHHHHHHHNRAHWVAPAIIGGLIGYTIANTARSESVPSVVYIEQTPINGFCPLSYRPVFQTVYLYDRWGRMIPQQQFLGCQ